MPKPDITILTDASETGWGITDWHNPSELQWAKHKRIHIINALELKAVFIGIRMCCHNRSYKHIRVMSSISELCQKALRQLHILIIIKVVLSSKNAKEIWLQFFNSNSFISAAHIAGKHNIEPDRFSRVFNNNTEWQLNPKIFAEITNKFGYPEIDLFATRINTQLQNYVPGHLTLAKAGDTFLTDCGKEFSYIFPEFSLLGKVTSKIWQDKTHDIVIIPKWTTQHWYPVIMEIPVSEITIKPAPNDLLLPQDKKKLHPFYKNLTLAAVLMRWE